MENWEIKLTKTAFDDFQKLPKPIAKSIKRKLIWLKNNFENISHLPLKGELKGLFKLRIGDYRIIYSIDWEEKKNFYFNHQPQKGCL